MNLTSLLVQQMNARPDALAIRYENGSLTYEGFGQEVFRAAGGLKKIGVSKGDVVAVELVNPLSHLTAILALAHVGATSASVSRITVESLREYLFDQTGCSILITDDIKAINEGARNLRVLNWDEITSLDAMASEMPEEMSRKDRWTYVTGSGSSGRPKIMPVTHAQQICRAKLGSSCLPYGSDDVLLSLVSMHFFASKQRALEAISSGAGLYLDIPGRIDHRDVVAQGDVTAIYATVVHIERLLRLLPAQNIPHYEKLRALMIGGSSVSMDLRERIRSQLTPNLHVLWGTNETHTSTITDVASVYRTNRTVGHAFPNYKIEVVDDKGEPAPPGRLGHIRVSSPTMIDGYLNDPEETRKVFKNGWFYTGDLGYFINGEELVHLGRADDMMNVGGVNLFPAEVEEALRGVPHVVDALACPLRDARTEQDIPVALVEVEPSITLEPNKLVEHVRCSVGAHALHDIRLVEKIPRNEQGKVQRKQLNQMLERLWGIKKQEDTHPNTREISTTHMGDELITVSFNRPDYVASTELKEWLSLLDDGLNKDFEFQSARKSLDADRIWLGQVLALARGYLNVLGVPLFDPLVIVDFHSSKESKNRSEAKIRLPEASLIPRTLVGAVLKVAFRHSTWLAKADVKSKLDCERFFNSITKDILQDLSKFRALGKSTFEILRVAHQMEIAYRQLPGGAYQLGWGSRARRIDRSTTDYDSALGMNWSRNKLLTAQLLREAGLPAPEHRLASTLTEAQNFASHIGFPVVVKPSDRDRGEGVEVDVRADAIKRAFDTAKGLSPSKTVLIERQVSGVCHRLFIVAGKLLYAVKRLPIGVYADGQRTIASIVESELQKQAYLPPWKKSGLRALDDMAKQMLKRQGWTPESVPSKDNFVALRRIETTAWGGVDEDVSALVHPENLKIALKATTLIGLEVAGVDIITDDISKPWYKTGAIINEINYAPLLGGGEISKRHIAQYLSHILEENGRIPIHVYLGGRQAFEKASNHWKHLCKSGTAAYFTSCHETRDASGDPTPILGRRLRRKLDVLRLRQDVEALIVVVQSVQCLHDIQVLNYVTSFDLVDSQPIKCLTNPQNIPSSTISTIINRIIARWSVSTTQKVDSGAPFKANI